MNPITDIQELTTDEKKLVNGGNGTKMFSETTMHLEDFNQQLSSSQSFPLQGTTDVSE